MLLGLHLFVGTLELPKFRMFQVKYFRPKTSINALFSDMFMPLKEKQTGFYDVLQRQGKNRPKHRYLRSFLANA